MSLEHLVRSNVLSLRPFSSARAEYSGEADVLLDANESPYASDINRYPDPHQRILKQLVARDENISTGQIIFGNGSDELIDIILRTFCTPGQDIVRYISPSFGMYEVCADINDITKEAILLDSAFDLDVDACIRGQSAQHKVLFLCSPNNPTGNLLSRSKIESVLKQWKGIVVIDEAYIEYASEESYVTMLKTHKHLIVLRTFSKAWGAAGLRLGLGIASEEIISYLTKIKPPYNVNALSQQKAKKLLSQKDIKDSHIRTTLEERTRLTRELGTIEGIVTLYPTDANFILARCRDYKGLYQHLMDQGVIVRDRSKLPGCQSCLRITVGLRKENDRLINGVKEFYL
jgi:histidinol-phosphate aminotransferase